MSYRLAIGKDSRYRKLRGVIFDMDGTLTQPQAWMFAEMRHALKVKPGVDVLEFVETLPAETEENSNSSNGDGGNDYDYTKEYVFDESPVTREEALRRLHYIDHKSMLRQKPMKGVRKTLVELQALGVQLGVCTRNVSAPVNYFMENVVNTDTHTSEDEDSAITCVEWVGPIVTREFDPPKPAAEPLLHIIDQFNKTRSNDDDPITPADVLMVGDSADDMKSGLNAGCGIVLISHGQHGNDKVAGIYDPDLVVNDLTSLVDHLKCGIDVKIRTV